MSELSDKIRDLIAAEKVSIKDAIAAMVEVQYDYLQGPSSSPKPQEASEAPKVVHTPKPRSVRYDPMYDPPPPFESDTPPPRTPHSTQVVSKAGTACVCDGCRKVVCVSTRDIFAGMGADDFLKSFKPMDGMKTLPEKIQLKWDDTGMWTDCPECGAELKLRLA